MLSKVLAIILMVGVLSNLVGCGAAPTPTPLPTSTLEPTTEPAPEAQASIVLGDISDEPAKKIKRFQPLADYLAKNLTEFGIGAGEVKIARDADTMAQWLASGKVDLYFDSLYPAMLVGDQSGAQPVLRRWKDGGAEYSSIIFAPTDGGLKTLDDLKSHVIAFEDPLSTSGYMLPLAYLKQAGLEAIKIDESDTEPDVPEGQIGYVFSKDDENTIQWVLSKKVSAGVVDNLVYPEIPQETREKLTVLAETEMVPRQVVMARPGMDPEMLESIKTLLTGLDEAAEGQEILTALKDTAQFDEFPQGAEAAIGHIRDLYELVQAP